MPPTTRYCQTCEFPIHRSAGATCPKCGETQVARATQGLLEVDIAHHGQHWDTARTQLLAAVNLALHGGHSGLKVIHGRGQANGYSTIKEMATAYLKSLARQHGGRIAADKGNPGATILWLQG